MLPVEATPQQDPRERPEDAGTPITNASTEEDMVIDEPEMNADDMPAADDVYDEE